MTRKILLVAVCCSSASFRLLVTSAYDGAGGPSAPVAVSGVAHSPQNFRIIFWTYAYHYFFLVELYFSMLLVLLIGPNLISQDLRFNALPLYFSRPLRRFDYFLGKLGVIVTFLGRMIVLPCLIAYILGLLFSLDLTIIRDTFRLLVSSITYGLIISVSAGLLILALSSLQ